MHHELLGLDIFYRMAGHPADGDTLDEILASVPEAAVALVNCDECSTYVRQGRELVPRGVEARKTRIFRAGANSANPGVRRRRFLQARSHRHF
jgi:hypothetical protein